MHRSPTTPWRHARRRHLAALTAALVAVLAAPTVASADVKVAFLQGEQVANVDRPGSTAADAISALLAGPTAAETAAGVRTYVPQQTALRSVSVVDGVANVDLSLPFVSVDDDPDSLRARLTQVVQTLTGPEGAKGVRLTIDGGQPLGLFPGVSATSVLTVGYLQTPNVKAPTTAAAKPPETKATTKPVSGLRAAQQRLAALGFLLPGDVDGLSGPVTQAAIIAYQKWQRLPRTGTLTAKTLSTLSHASRPKPETRGGSGKRAEVLLDRQVVLAIENNVVVRTLHVSTGAPATPTPPGDFKVYAQFTRWWSVPFAEWLLWASPFNAGIAFHQLAEVPVYPASHGCVRLTAAQAKWLYDFLDVGNPVKVITRS